MSLVSRYFALGPDIDVAGNTQRFSFNKAESASDYLGNLDVFNGFTPLINVPSLGLISLTNKFLSGYRFAHQTMLGETVGNLFLQYFSGLTSPVDLMKYDFLADEFVFLKNITAPNISLKEGESVASTNYVDTKTWTIDRITDFGTTINSYNFTNKDYVDAKTWTTNRITDLITFINNYNFTNKSYVDSKTWLTSSITDLATFISSYDFANKDYVKSRTWKAADITDLVTFINSYNYTAKSYVDAKTWTVDKITDFSSSIENYNFTNKTYVDNKVWTTLAITDFTEAVLKFRLDQLANPTSPINVIDGVANTHAASLGQLKTGIDQLGLKTVTGTGLMVRTGANSYQTTQVAVGISGNLTIANANAVSGNPTIDLAKTINCDRVTINNDPVSSTDGVNQAYVDKILDATIGGISWKNPVRCATTTNLDANYDNGTQGIGATLTNKINGVLIADGITPNVGDRIAVKDQSLAATNGLYVVTNKGSGTTKWILTRSIDFNNVNEIKAGSVVAVQDGDVNKYGTFFQNYNVTTIGVDSITFTQYGYNASKFLEWKNNLSDLGDTAIARANLGLANAILSASTDTNSLTVLANGNSLKVNLNTQLNSFGSLVGGGFLQRDSTTGNLAFLSQLNISTHTSGNLPTNRLSANLQSIDSVSSSGIIKCTANNTFSSVSTVDINTETSGNLAFNRLALSGTSNTATFVKSDGSHATPPNSGGTVTSITVAVSTGMTGGGTVNTSGSINVGLGSELQALSSALSTTGFIRRTALNTYSLANPVTSITGTLNQIINSGTATDPILGLSPNPILTGTDGITIPIGTTAQRTAVTATNNGRIRYNTSLNVFEGVINGAYANFGTVSSVSGTTNQITNSGTATDPILSLASNTILPGTGAVTIPIGTTAQVPSTATSGMLRYDSTTNAFIGRVGSSWLTLATTTNAADPVNPLDLANKKYVDTIKVLGNYTLNLRVGNYLDHLVFSSLSATVGVGSGISGGVSYGASTASAIHEFFSPGSTTARSSIKSDGSFLQSSDRDFKESIRQKNIEEKDYLQRILDLPIYSYSYKSESDSHTDKQLALGVMYDEVEKNFNGNCISKPKLQEGIICDDSTCIACNPNNKAVIYNHIFLYHILAFQSFFNKEYLPLKEKIIKLEKAVFKN